METEAAINALDALAHPTRLEAFRILVRAGEAGVAAGELAGLLGTPASTLSSHLARLDHAGLVRACRAGWHIFYRADFATMRALIDFLTRDCCAGLPGLVPERHPFCLEEPA
ncbi:MAG: ArsR/SmtB family transcription factor [Sphingomonadaceae bacterium]